MVAYVLSTASLSLGVNLWENENQKKTLKNRFPLTSAHWGVPVYHKIKRHWRKPMPNYFMPTKHGSPCLVRRKSIFFKFRPFLFSHRLTLNSLHLFVIWLNGGCLVPILSTQPNPNVVCIYNVQKSVQKFGRSLIYSILTLKILAVQMSGLVDDT